MAATIEALLRRVGATRYWPLNEKGTPPTGDGWRDLIGRQHLGTANAPVSHPEGPVALRPGSTDFGSAAFTRYLERSGHSLNLNRDFTISMWVRLNTATLNGDCLLGQGTGLGNYWILIHRDDQDGLTWQLDPGGGAKYGPVSGAAGLRRAPAGVWTHYFARRQYSTVSTEDLWSISKNGGTESQNTRSGFSGGVPGANQNSTDPLNVGRLAFGSNYMDGRLAHLAYIPRSLTARERAELYLAQRNAMLRGGRRVL